MLNQEYSLPEVPKENFERFSITELENQEKIENIKIPKGIDYYSIKQISTESKEKLSKIMPETIGQAMRIGGVKPADISVLMVLIEQHRVNLCKA